MVQDKAKMNSLIQEIMKIDFKEFNKQSAQKYKKSRTTSGSESNGSQSRAQARRRQGTPVNVKSPQEEQSNYSHIQASARQHYPAMGSQEQAHQAINGHERLSSAENCQSGYNRGRIDSKNSS